MKTIAILMIISIVFLAACDSEQEEAYQQQPDYNVVSVGEPDGPAASYSKLETSADDFYAIDDAMEYIE